MRSNLTETAVRDTYLLVTGTAVLGAVGYWYPGAEPTIDAGLYLAALAEVVLAITLSAVPDLTVTDRRLLWLLAVTGCAAAFVVDWDRLSPWHPTEVGLGVVGASVLWRFVKVRRRA